MPRIGWMVLLALLATPFTNALAQAPPPPKVFPSTPVNDSRYAYAYRPGNVHVRPRGPINADDLRPAFDGNTAESLKRYCSTAPKNAVEVLAAPQEANYVVFYSTGIRADLIVVRSDGEVIWGRKGFWKGSLVKRACEAIVSDCSTQGGVCHPNP